MKQIIYLFVSILIATSAMAGTLEELEARVDQERTSAEEARQLAQEARAAEQTLAAEQAVQAALAAQALQALSIKRLEAEEAAALAQSNFRRAQDELNVFRMTQEAHEATARAEQAAEDAKAELKAAEAARAARGGQ